MQAKLKGAKLIHVDPRFTRTSAMCDIHAPIRAGSDIAFLGGLIHYVINNERWNSDSFFREYLLNYTNAATLIDDAFQDTEDLQGTFSGLRAYEGGSDLWPFNGFQQEYDEASWQYASGGGESQGWTAATARSGEQDVQKGDQ
jgi:formate dehydrogenase major subunit